MLVDCFRPHNERLRTLLKRVFDWGRQFCILRVSGFILGHMPRLMPFDLREPSSGTKPHASASLADAAYG